MERIEHLNTIKAPISSVYQALITEDGLGNVWTKKLTVKPEVGFVNVFDFDEGYLTKMEVIELRENEKVTWECIASDEEWVATKVAFDLSEAEGTTTIILRHTEWREMTDYFRWCNYHWAMFLFRLKRYCEEHER